MSVLANHLRGRIDSGSISVLDLYERVVARIAALDRQAAEGERIRASVQWVEEGEASTRFFLRLEKKHALEEWVCAIRDSDRVLKLNIDGICCSWVAFFSSLFLACPTDTSVQDELLSNVSARLPPGSETSCDGLLTVAEVHRELRLVNQRAPTDFLSNSTLAFGEDLVDVLNSSYQAGRLPRCPHNANL